MKLAGSLALSLGVCFRSSSADVTLLIADFVNEDRYDLPTEEELLFALVVFAGERFSFDALRGMATARGEQGGS